MKGKKIIFPVTLLAVVLAVTLLAGCGTQKMTVEEQESVERLDASISEMKARISQLDEKISEVEAEIKKLEGFKVDDPPRPLR